MSGTICRATKSVAIFMRGSEFGSKWRHLGEIKAVDKDDAVAKFFRVKPMSIKKVDIGNSNIGYEIPFKPNMQISASIL